MKTKKNTFGIGIPTYGGHLWNLKDLLLQISKSTVLPDQVSVSISSFDGEIDFDDYPFELIVKKHKEYRNTSQNLNTCGSMLSTDIISFMGGDDIPHIKRNEYILKSFELGAKIVVHNYQNQTKGVKEFNSNIGEIQLHIDYIDTYTSDVTFPICSNEKNLCFANGPISITKELFEKYKYGETDNFIGKEDSMYNSGLVKDGYKLSYIRNPLMFYIH
jgi:hypothetical protein